MPQSSPHIYHDEHPAVARLFFALTPDEATRDAIYKASRNLAQNSGGRAMPPELFHITLAFLGSVQPEQEERVVTLAAATAEEVPSGPFSFGLDQLGYWPNSKVIWYGCSHTPVALRDLALDLRRRLANAALPPAPGKFVPHVTLARWVRKTGPFPEAERIPWEVREFTLLRSETLVSGVRYTELARCPLGRQGSLI